MGSKKDKKIKFLILVKNIDGGTGTFIISFLNIKKIFKPYQIILKTLVLEKPTFRTVDLYNFEYLRKKDFYPQKYSISPFNFINFFSELLWINKKISMFEPTVILAVDLRCNLLAIMSKFLSINKIKIIATNHIDLGRTIFDKSTKVTNLFLRQAIKLFYDEADKLVCVSENLSKSLKKDFNLRKEIITIYNGLDLRTKKPKRYSNKKKKIIITLARLVEQKDHVNLIKAFNLLQKDLPETNLWIASDGPERNILETLVTKLNLGEKVKFLGWVKNVNSYLRKSDLFVVSSKREGFGYVLIEAMSQGIPVISTNTPFGPSEVLGSGKYGTLVPVNDSSSLSDAMYKLLTKKKRYEYFARRSTVRSKFFSQEKMLADYKKIIMGLSKN